MKHNKIEKRICILLAAGDIVVNYNAYAKVNLGLNIIGKRPDGYHEIETLMVTVDLCDTVEVSEQAHGIQIVCPELVGVPGTDNIAYKAANCFLSTHSSALDKGLAIHIAKNIPVGAGMGGGSSDAAAVLLAMQDLAFGSPLQDTDYLVELGAKVGSDVAFFVGANSKPPRWHSALCRGRGEYVERVVGREFWLVMVFPEIPISTEWAYKQYDALSTSTVLSSCAKRRRMDALLDVFASGDSESLGRSVFNDLETPVCKCYPFVSRIKDALVSAGAHGACMTGSGSAVYGICDSFEESLVVKERLTGMLPREAGPCAVKIAKTRG